MRATERHDRAYAAVYFAPASADRFEVQVMWQKVVIVLVFIAIIYNLGAGLYYMITDKGATNRTVDALTRRIAISVVLFLLVGFAIWMGWISPHGIVVR
jgi:succinate dehydrogenase/fumarate reductase cytochrome b subunit